MGEGVEILGSHSMNLQPNGTSVALKGWMTLRTNPNCVVLDKTCSLRFHFLICRKCFSLNTTLFMFICELVEIKILSDKRWFLKKI